MVPMIRQNVCSAIFSSPGAQVGTIGSRGTVSGSAPMFGGFALKESSVVMIAVRGASLQSLGLTQNPLNSPKLRIYDATNADLVFTGNVAGVTNCAPTNPTAAYYQNVRHQPLNRFDTCALPLMLGAGVYTFSISPGSADTNGEVLFEVTLNPERSPQATSLTSIGTRATVSTSAPMYGGFTLAEAKTIYFAVRGPSLQSLGFTSNPLDAPKLRVYDSGGGEYLLTNGQAGVSTCPSTHETAQYYTSKGNGLNVRDTCASLTLAAGIYTFTVEANSGDPNGEALFEVTFGP